MISLGSATLVLLLEDGEKVIELNEPGEYVVIPKNTWHTAKVTDKAKMLFITPGEGTQNKEI